MKKPAIPFLVVALTFSALLIPQVYASSTSISNKVNSSAKSSNGGDASVNVNIRSEGNYNSNNGDNEFEENTSVDIIHEGEGGESSVTINGKEWKLSGPGEIHENTKSSSTPKPTTKPTTNPSQSPTPSPTPSPSPSATASAEPEDQESEGIDGIIELLENLLEKFKELRLKI